MDTVARQIMATYVDSPSFSFTTPEQQRQRRFNTVEHTANEKWHFRDSPSPIPASQYQEKEQDENKAHEVQHQHWSFAHSDFRRRNKLETRLEELQKDVASLTLRLRNNGSRNTSLDTSSFLYAPKEQEETKWDKTPRNADKRRKTEKAIVTGSRITSSAVKTLRKLHDVTTEKEQLKFELERTKKALASAEKKLLDAQKSKKAYEKLKAHCDSLQESLDLSEKIRARQKKLLQQLQLQQPPRKDREVGSARTKRSGSGGFKTRDGSEASPTTPKLSLQNTKTHGCAHIDCNISNSLVASSYHQDDEGEDAGLSPHEQAPSEPTAATSQVRTPHSKLKSTTPTSKAYRQDFDSLLQVNTPRFSTRRPSRCTTWPHQRPSQTQIQQRDVMRQAAKWVRSRGGAVDNSTSTTLRRTATASRSNSRFLAPTQASLRRQQDLPRHNDLNRPPFIV